VLLRTGEDGPDLALGLADILVEQLRTLDVQEVAARRVGDSLGDHGLAAAGRAVQQHALWRAQPELAEQFPVAEGQLDGVPDLLDLRTQAADVGVSDVGHFLQGEVGHLAAGHGP